MIPSFIKWNWDTDFFTWSCLLIGKPESGFWIWLFRCFLLIQQFQETTIPEAPSLCHINFMWKLTKNQNKQKQNHTNKQKQNPINKNQINKKIQPNKNNNQTKKPNTAGCQSQSIFQLYKYYWYLAVEVEVDLSLLYWCN